MISVVVQVPTFGISRSGHSYRNQEDVIVQIFVAYSRALALGFDLFSFPDSDSPAHSSETSDLASRERTYCGTQKIKGKPLETSEVWKNRRKIEKSKGPIVFSASYVDKTYFQSDSNRIF